MYVFCNQINIKKLLQYHGIKEKIENGKTIKTFSLLIIRTRTFSFKIIFKYTKKNLELLEN